MGFLDKLIKGAQMLGEMASEMNTAERSVSGPVHTAPYVPEKSFEEKLQTVLQNAGSYELRNNISPDELEREFGQEIYTRKGCKRPENITYGIYQAGNRVLLIRLWTNYGDYNHRANRQIREFCESHGAKILDFFGYLPNEESYMDQRIRANL